MTAKFTNKAKFFFEHAPDYRTHHVDGVWGGPTSKGLVHANFFFDTPFTPLDVTLRVPEGGGVAVQEAVTERPEDPDVANVRRTLNTAILLTPEDAVAIGQWLITHGQGLLAMRDGTLSPEAFAAKVLGTGDGR